MRSKYVFLMLIGTGKDGKGSCWAGGVWRWAVLVVVVAVMEVCVRKGSSN